MVKWLLDASVMALEQRYKTDEVARKDTKMAGNCDSDGEKSVYRLLANKQGDKWFILERAVRTKEQFYMSSFTCWDSTMSTIEQIEIPIYEFTSKTLPMRTGKAL